MKKKGYLFLYYEDNYNECAMDSEASIAHELYEDTRDVARCAMERIKTGIEGGFVVDDQVEAPTEEIIEKAIRERSYYQVTMFFEYQGNYEKLYEIVVTSLKVIKHDKKPQDAPKEP